MKRKTAMVLIVEDESDINDVYKLVLERAGYEVKAAYNGREALAITKEIEPDVILLDLRMPEMDGIQFLKKYDIAKSHPKVKVIILSNYDMQKEIAQAYELGANHYVLKAWISPKELEKLVENALKNRKPAKPKAR